MPVLQFSPVVGIDGNHALNSGAGVMLTFRAGDKNAPKSTIADFARLAHGRQRDSLAVAASTVHIFWLVLVVRGGVFKRQPDALALVIFPGRLINRAFSTDLATKGNFNHILSLGVTPYLNLIIRCYDSVK